MVRLLLIAVLISLAGTLSAQDIHIYYDVAKDSVTYMQNGNVIKEPNLKKGAQLILHVQNFNDYIYDVKVETEKTNLEIPSAGAGQFLSLDNVGSVFGKLKDAAGNFTTGGFDFADENFGGDRDGFGDADDEVATSSTSSQEKSILEARFQQAIREMAEIEEEVVEIGEDIQSDLRSQQFNAFMQEEVKDLKYKHDIPPNVLKDIALQYMERMLDIKEGRDFDLDKLFDRADVKKSIGGKVSEYSAEVTSLEEKLASLSLTKDLLLALDYQATEKLSFITAFDNAKKRTENYAGKVAVMEEQVPTLENWSIKDFANIRYQYEEMKNHSFERKITLSPDADINNIKISLIPIDSARVNGARKKELNNIRVPVYGGLRVNASVGVSFASFFERPQTYLTRDNRIIGDDLDPFSPIVTSFIHFYSPGKRQVALGGTFGLGIGIGGESNGLQTYFLGPSLIIGKGQRVVLSSGLMGGKVERLADGLSVGDVFEETNLPTKDIYELGYFIGVSFNILGN